MSRSRSWIWSIALGLLLVAAMSLSAGFGLAVFLLDSPSVAAAPERVDFASAWRQAVALGTAEGEIKPITGPTESMLPTMQTGQRMVVSRVSHLELKVGDIVIVYQWQPFQHGGQELILVGHRIVDLGEDEQGWWAVTKGDNNLYRDQTLRRADDLCCKIIAVLYE